MKRNLLAAIIPTVLILTLSVAFATSHEAAEKGKILFENPNLAGGVKACSSCHPNGEGLFAAGSKTGFTIMGEEKKSLEAVINFCIVNANRGKAIAEDSDEMQEIVSYIKSLGTKGATGNGSPGYDEKK